MIREITQFDLLTINKTDLAAGIDADLKDMKRSTKNAWFRTAFSQIKHGNGVDEILDHIIQIWQRARGVSTWRGLIPFAENERDYGG